jgi:hypothetical protein
MYSLLNLLAGTHNGYITCRAFLLRTLLDQGQTLTERAASPRA